MFACSSVVDSVLTKLKYFLSTSRLPPESPLSESRYLPDEILTDILFRLPGKSLLRFKSVCKEWHAIISSSSFVNAHFNCKTNHTDLALYCFGGQTYNPYFTYSYFTDQTTLEKHDMPDNLLLWGEITYFRGPCNGIFCIFITKNKFALWNPTTRKTRFIQCCPSYIFDEVGFGVDPVTGDFKIVLIRCRMGVSPCFAVYTSGTDSWKYLEQESLCDPSAMVIDSFSIGKNAYYNGFYYWIKEVYPIRKSYILLAFDMHNEIFEEIIMPETVGEGNTLHLFNESLALVTFDPFNGDKRMEIWLMEEKGRWSKFLSVVPPFQCTWSYGFWGTGILIRTLLGDDTNLMVYDLDSHIARQIKVDNVNGFTQTLPIFTKESLFSLKDNDRIQEYDSQSPEALEFMGYEGPKTKFSAYNFVGAIPFEGSIWRPRYDERMTLMSKIVLTSERS